MPRVFVIPHYENEGLFSRAASRCNAAQGDFRLHILPPDTDATSPLSRESADFREILPYLEGTKSRLRAMKDDLVIALFDGRLTAKEAHLSNLFMAGARYDEPFPCTAVISMRFISWGVLEEKYDYDVQCHALLHLLICGLWAPTQKQTLTMKRSAVCSISTATWLILMKNFSGVTIYAQNRKKDAIGRSPWNDSEIRLYNSARL